MEGIAKRWIWKGLIERLKIGDQVIELDLHLSMSKTKCLIETVVECSNVS